MDTFPDFNMYAVLKDNIVIDVGFGINEFSLVDYNSKPIINTGDFVYVQMTPENSPAETGMKYNGKTFSY
jgi:hypothetical protein